MKKVFTSLVLLAVAFATLVGCESKADVASYNLSEAADQFEINRRIVFFNGITDTYLMTIEGRCSIEADGADAQLEVTCAVGDDKYKKHFLGLSDNVSYFVEQIQGVDVDTYRYRVIFRPETIIPDPEIDTSGD
jgi:hypothetical protein